MKVARVHERLADGRAERKSSANIAGNQAGMDRWKIGWWKADDGLIIMDALIACNDVPRATPQRWPRAS